MTRSRFCSLRIAVVTSGLTVALASLASAQDATSPPPPVMDAPLPSAPVSPEPQPYVEPLPPPVVTESAPTLMEEPSIVQKEPLPTEETPAEEPEKVWYDNFSIGAFVDAYGAIRSDSNNRTLFGGSPAGGYYHEAYVQADGFALAFGGVDLAYSSEKVGATMSLRFGPGVPRFYGSNKSDLGIENLTQAFVTYKPTETLTLDLGQFGTIYGAEVLESWKNVNYSRGALYYAMQPFWHTGLRANLQLADAIALNAMIVNGTNTPFEDNSSPSLGLQAVLTPNDTFFLALGYLGAINPRSGGEQASNFDHFIDLVATVTAGDFRLVANADFNLYRTAGVSDGENWWGVSLAPAYAFTDWFGAALRVEYLKDSANLWGMRSDDRVPVEASVEDMVEAFDPMNLADASTLTTLTATLDFKPVASLIIRPEFRYEMAGDYYFVDKDNAPTKNFWKAMIGVVVATNP